MHLKLVKQLIEQSKRGQHATDVVLWGAVVEVLEDFEQRLASVERDSPVVFRPLAEE